MLFFEKKLKRTELIEICDEGLNQYHNPANEDKLYILKAILNTLEKKLNEVDCKKSKEFFNYGRRGLLREQFAHKVHKANFEVERDYLMDSFNTLNLYIRVDNLGTISNLPGNISELDVTKKDELYRKSGIICKEEKDTLIEMIDMLQEAIVKEENTTKYDEFEEIYDEEVVCPYCGQKTYRTYIYGQELPVYDENLYIYGGPTIDFSKKYQCKICGQDFK